MSTLICLLEGRQDAANKVFYYIEANN